MKGKKKATPLSSLNKAFGIAANFPSMNPSEFRQRLPEYRARCKTIRDSLGLEGSIYARPRPKIGFEGELREITCREHQREYAAVIRDILLGAWYSEKIVYTVPRDVMDFLETDFPVAQMDLDLAAAIEKLCQKPVYIEFLDDNDGLLGAFCGMTSIGNEDYLSEAVSRGLGESVFIFSSSIIINGHSKVYLHLNSKLSSIGFFADDSLEPEVRKLMKAILYISCMSIQKDAKGLVLLESNRQGTPSWLVRPVPYPDAIPGFVRNDGWMISGMRSFLNYLSRDTMLKELEADMKEYEQYKDYPISNDDAAENQPAVSYRLAKTMFDWEQSRAVFQYDAQAEEKFIGKYLDTLCLSGFPERLLQYIPYKTVVLYQKESEAVVLISRCRVKEASGSGLLIGVIMPREIKVSVVPASRSGALAASLSDIATPYLSALCAMYHVLSVLEQKEIKRLAKDLLNNPDHMELVPVPQHETVQKQNTGERYSPDDVRIGQPVEEIPFDLFDVTGRTVKKAKREVRRTSAGWTMVPHTRRSHPHRYWVGSGEKKHLETRWLEESHIHGGKQNAPTVVLELK